MSMYRASLVMKPGPLHEKVKPFCWLMGKWQSISAEVSYPTMKNSVPYREELIFAHLGQQFLNYSSVTWNKETKKPMHLESGFLGLIDQNAVVLLTSQNFGLITREIGSMKNNTLILNAKDIICSPWAKKPVTGIYRCFRLNCEGGLEMCMFLETPQTPPTLHLTAKYNKDAC